jgi:predicted amidohydrolase
MDRVLNVALIQQDTVWEEPAGTQQSACAAIAAAAQAGARVVALTEMFATGFTMAALRFAEPLPGPTSAALSEAARAHRVWVIGTCIERTGGRPRNAAFALNPEGELVAVYRKIHPFSFGQENQHYDGGDAAPIFDLDGVKTGLQICYDLRFPETFRALAGRGAELCFVPANWPSRRAAHWSTLLAARAIEDQMVICGINRVGRDPNVEYPGLSGIYDARGELLARGGSGPEIVQAGIDFAHVTAWRAEFPALRDRRPEVYARL